MTQLTRERFFVSPNDIQENIVRSTRAQVAAYAFFSIADPQKFRDFVRGRCGGSGASQAPGAGTEPADLLDVLKSADVRILPERERGKPHVGLTLAFTWSGLQALQVDPVTLETFPEPFKEGMAARAHLLGDSGESAPSAWEGWLGHRNVHGLMGVLVSSTETGAGAPHAGGSKHEAGAASRASGSVRGAPKLFSNTAALAKRLARSGEQPPTEIVALERVSGLRILHLEIGYTPRKEFQGERYRVEHFGFRDGVSQPFVDLGLRPPPPGGGTPRRDGTWAPVAPGEIFLGHPDEDGLRAIQPANKELRTNGTYMVFRKLAQEVVGFHHFIQARARDKAHEQLLAAQMFGRWQNGAALSRMPASAQ